MDNLFRVTNDSDMDEIIADNSFRLVIICVIIKNHQLYKTIKEHFMILAANMRDCFFTFIDLNNFSIQTQNNKYINDIKTIPKFMIYYNNHELASIQSFDKEQFTNIIIHMNNKIKEKIKEAKTIENNEIQKKMENVQPICTIQNLQKLKELQENKENKEVKEVKEI